MKERLEIKGAIIGMLFGDASLSHDRKNAVLRISHCSDQEEYMLWKAESVLRKVTTYSTWRGTVKAFGKEHEGLRLWTKSHPFYTGLRNRMYQEDPRRKTFDIHCLKRLNLMGLLFWFLDDGTRVVVKNTNGIMLCTDRYNYIEHLSLQKYFHDVWNLIAKINRHGKHWRMRFGVREAEKIHDLFAPLHDQIPECVRWKVDLSYGTPKQIRLGKRQSTGQ